MEEQKQGFDYRTHIMNPKTGKLEIEQHYKMTISRTEGTKIERPIGSGKFYYGDGTLINPEPQAVEQKVEHKKVEGK